MAGMGVNRQHVQDWLEENLELANFEITEMPLVPGGVIVKDKTEESMLVYWDLFERKIVWEFQ